MDISFASVIDSLGGPAALARSINLPTERVKKWKARNIIPAYAWLDVLTVASEQGENRFSCVVFARLARGLK